ncbi:asparagine synthase-related protein [Kribbella antibiotica]|uniref:asparagine synthase-related protein n=1 Tax=Kribbella antibiotica TaxID=190195 RepID=UPI0014050F15|nr:asparagine synthase-related protein [Kribbella antibiotica]
MLPDVEAARGIAERLPAEQTLRHPSGRPLVLGRWDSFSERNGRVEIGEVGLSAHVLESVGDRVRVRGTASGLRRVFQAVVDGVVVASDRADVLAELIGAGPDPLGIALRLLLPGAPWPLAWHSVWSGVSAVPPGYWVELPSGRHERWWTPPAPDLPLADAAVLLREALADAVSIRQQGKGKVACDLSGLDSSSLFGLAVQGGPVVALTYQTDDPMDGDLAVARYLVEHFGASHDVLAVEGAPLPLHGMATDPGPFDEPTWVSGHRARIGTASARAARHQAELRLAGHGADELLLPPPVWLNDIARRNPLRAARIARQVQAKYRLPGRTMTRLLTDRTSYGEWFANSLDRSSGWDIVDWGTPPGVPGWLSGAAVEQVRDAMAGTAGEPLAEARGMHATLAVVHVGALGARHVAQLGEADGVPVAMPFFDDRVLEACLAVRPEEAIDPRRYKPQLVAAMADVLPAQVLTRTDKADFAMTIGRAWRAHRSELLELLDDSELWRLGLVDVDAVRRVVRGPYVEDTGGPVWQLLEVEAWLKGLR